MRNLLLAASVFLPLSSALASYQTIEVSCLNKVTRKSYGTSGNYIHIEDGAMILLRSELDGQPTGESIDLKQGECTIHLVTIPDTWD